MKPGSVGCFAAIALLLVSCSSQINTSSSPLSTVEKQNASSFVKDNSGQFALNDSAANMAQEQAVADGCLKAWRMALKGDEAGAMKLLGELDKKNPGISTVQFMMGQVEEHCGKPEEAVKHYLKAHDVNEFSSVQTFKLAESLRKAGKPKEAVVYYKKLVEKLDRATKEHKKERMSELLVSVRLGLAHAYHEGKENDNALSEVKAILQTNPDSKEAQSLLKELERSRS